MHKQRTSPNVLYHTTLKIQSPKDHTHPSHGSHCNLTFDRSAVEPNDAQAPSPVINIYETSIEMHVSNGRYDAQKHVRHKC